MKHLPQLQKLDLGATSITGEGLENLAGSTDLRELNLADTQVTDAGLEHCKGLIHLEELNLLLEAGTREDDQRVIAGREQTIGAAMLNGELGARWLGRLSLVVAVFNAVAVWEAATFSTYHGGGWAAPDWVAFLGFVVVVLLIGVSMLRKPEMARSPSGPAVLTAS